MKVCWISLFWRVLVLSVVGLFMMGCGGTSTFWSSEIERGQAKSEYIEINYGESAYLLWSEKAIKSIIGSIDSLTITPPIPTVENESYLLEKPEFSNYYTVSGHSGPRLPHHS